MAPELLRLLALELRPPAIQAAWLTQGLPKLALRAFGQTLEVWVVVEGVDWGLAC